MVKITQSTHPPVSMEAGLLNSKRKMILFFFHRRCSCRGSKAFSMLPPVTKATRCCPAVSNNSCSALVQTSSARSSPGVGASTSACLGRTFLAWRTWPGCQCHRR
jgi:hypothetical protein